MMLHAEMTPMAIGHPHRGSVLVRFRGLLPRHRALSREEQILRYEVLRDREERERWATLLASRIV